MLWKMPRQVLQSSGAAVRGGDQRLVAARDEPARCKWGDLQISADLFRCGKGQDVHPAHCDYTQYISNRWGLGGVPLLLYRHGLKRGRVRGVQDGGVSN